MQWRWAASHWLDAAETQGQGPGGTNDVWHGWLNSAWSNLTTSAKFLPEEITVKREKTCEIEVQLAGMWGVTQRGANQPSRYFNDLDASGFSGRQVHCGQQGQQGGQDQGGGWHDPYPGFSKIFKSGPNVSKSVLEWSKSIFWVFLTVTHILDHFLTALDTFEKNGLRVMSASSLVLSSLLSLLSTVHLPTRESWRV